jgi:hypothetical protein
MAFDEVAIDDGCVTGLELHRNVVTCLAFGEVTVFLGVDDEAGLFQVLGPAVAATSARTFVDFDEGQRPVVSHR